MLITEPFDDRRRAPDSRPLRRLSRQRPATGRRRVGRRFPFHHPVPRRPRPADLFRALLEGHRLDCAARHRADFHPRRRGLRHLSLPGDRWQELSQHRVLHLRRRQGSPHRGLFRRCPAGRAFPAAGALAPANNLSRIIFVTCRFRQGSFVLEVGAGGPGCRSRPSGVAPPRNPNDKSTQGMLMRFMMLMIPLGYETAAPDVQLDPERVTAMMRYNEALKDAGVLITLDGLHPPSMGARVSFAAGKPIVTDGPFAEAKEVLGGYWMIEVASRAEAIAWAKKCPAAPNEIIEIRHVQEMSDFPPDVQEAAGFGDLKK